MLLSRQLSIKNSKTKYRSTKTSSSFAAKSFQRPLNQNKRGGPSFKGVGGRRTLDITMDKSGVNAQGLTWEEFVATKDSLPAEEVDNFKRMRGHYQHIKQRKHYGDVSIITKVFFSGTLLKHKQWRPGLDQFEKELKELIAYSTEYSKNLPSPAHSKENSKVGQKGLNPSSPEYSKECQRAQTSLEPRVRSQVESRVKASISKEDAAIRDRIYFHYFPSTVRTFLKLSPASFHRKVEKKQKLSRLPQYEKKLRRCVEQPEKVAFERKIAHLLKFKYFRLLFLACRSYYLEVKAD